MLRKLLNQRRGGVRRARAKTSAATFPVADAAAPPLAAGSYDVVLCRHVLWALPDPATAFACWVSLLRPGSRLVLVEGHWHTGAGLTAAETEALLRGAGREPATYRLDDPAYWGGPLTDERYLTIG